MITSFIPAFCRAAHAPRKTSTTRAQPSGSNCGTSPNSNALRRNHRSISSAVPTRAALKGPRAANARVSRNSTKSSAFILTRSSSALHCNTVQVRLRSAITTRRRSFWRKFTTFAVQLHEAKRRFCGNVSHAETQGDELNPSPLAPMGEIQGTTLNIPALPYSLPGPPQDAPTPQKAPSLVCTSLPIGSETSFAFPLNE